MTNQEIFKGWIGLKHQKIRFGITGKKLQWLKLLENGSVSGTGKLCAFCTLTLSGPSDADRLGETFRAHLSVI
jgi:hypothetical protein